MMGELEQYYITMLVDFEKEKTIRSLFKEKTWPCLIKVVTEENVTAIMKSGFTEVFTRRIDDYKTEDTEEVKQEYISVKTDKRQRGRLADDIHTEKKEHLSNGNNHHQKVNIDCDNTDSDNFNDMYHSVKESLKKHQSTSNKSDNLMIIKKLRCKVSSEKRTTKSKIGRKSSQLQSDFRKEVKNFKLDKREKKKTEFQCSMCGLYLATKASLHRHCQSRHGEEWFEFKCKDCPCMFKKLEELWKHRNDIKHDPPKVNPKFSEKKNLSPEELEKLGHLKCTACSKILPSRRLLRRHYYADHRECMPGPLCAVCGTEFKTRQELWKHKREMKHNDSLSLLQTYQCEECGKVLTGGFSSFKLHQKFACKEVEDAPQMPCDICGGLFKSKSHVQQHKKRTHMNVPVVCDTCGTVCKNKHSLNSHKRRHDAKNKKHVCDNCGKAFINKLLLIMHMRTHTKEKPFKCPLCDHRCAIKQNIQKHSLNVHKTQVKCSDIVTMSGAGSCDYNSSTQNGQKFKPLCISNEEIVKSKERLIGKIESKDRKSNNYMYDQVNTCTTNDTLNERNSTFYHEWQRSDMTENGRYKNNSDKNYPFNAIDAAYDLTLCKQNTVIKVENDKQKRPANVTDPVDNISAVQMSSTESYTELTNCRVNPFSYSHTSMDSTQYTDTWANTENR